MVLESLSRAILLLSRTPVLWLPGLVIGLFGVMDLIVLYHLGDFVAGRLAILELISAPFLVAGMMHVIRSGEGALGRFLEGGRKYYLRILIPTVILLFAWILTVILLLVPLSIMGIALEMLPFILAGSAVGISFFTFFYDAAAAFEDAKVIDSIRRSSDLVLKNPGATIIFYLVVLAVSAFILFIVLLIWTAVLYESLTPLIGMDPASLQSFTPDDLIALIGPQGLGVTAILYMAAIIVIFPFIYTYKSTFFQKYARLVESESLPRGEFDSKGRWYKY